MKRIVYRGISLAEGETVVTNQKYNRNEPREFENGVQAKSIFGPGLYLISNIELAAQYAFCHAEIESAKLAVVLKQYISLESPLILNHLYTESQLRDDAFNWKYKDNEIPDVDFIDNSNSLELTKWIGEIIKEYLLYHDYDGIIYHINDEIIYYISYFQEEQIENITYDFVFDIKEIKNTAIPILRESYKKELNSKK